MAKAIDRSEDLEHSANVAPLRFMRDEVAQLRRDMEAQAQRFNEVLANLEFLVADGYFVKVWPDVSLNVWIAHCPTVRCVVQEATRDQAVAAAAESIREMLEVLGQMGADVPPRDVPTLESLRGPARP